jgi:hypothetical protein
MGIIDADVYTAQIRRAAQGRGVNLTLEQVGNRSVFGVRSRPTGWGR